jgi:hypothetical protein
LAFGERYESSIRLSLKSGARAKEGQTMTIISMRMLTAEELDMVGGGKLSDAQKTVLVWTGPAGFVFWSLTRGLFGEDPIHW